MNIIILYYTIYTILITMNLHIYICIYLGFISRLEPFLIYRGSIHRDRCQSKVQWIKIERLVDSKLDETKPNVLLNKQWIDQNKNFGGFKQFTNRNQIIYGIDRSNT